VHTVFVHWNTGVICCWLSVVLVAVVEFSADVCSSMLGCAEYGACFFKPAELSEAEDLCRHIAEMHVWGSVSRHMAAYAVQSRKPCPGTHMSKIG
jgi:hypothetical protein